MFRDRSRSILYVENDGGSFDFLTGWLAAERGDCEVVRASYEEDDAEQLLAQRRFDLVVLDDGMTDTAAVELCRHLREWDLLTPIIIFSAASADEATDRAASSGATAYVNKPDLFGQMLSTIDEYLPRKSAERLRYLRGPRARSTTIL